jgi:hypothetical protein
LTTVSPSQNNFDVQVWGILKGFFFQKKRKQLAKRPTFFNDYWQTQYFCKTFFPLNQGFFNLIFLSIKLTKFCWKAFDPDTVFVKKKIVTSDGK